MNNKVNYTLIGFFVFIGVSLIFWFIYWLIQPSSEIEMKKYAINFDESVLGLNIDADVKYRGISVGKVTSLKINPENMEQVKVEINILKSTPIKEDTVAKLTAQGITGLSYINLSMGHKDSPYLRRKKGEEFPVIKTIPSFFEEFESSFGSVSTGLSSTLYKVEKVLNEENQAQVAQILKSTANILEKLDNALDKQTVANMQESTQNINNISKKVDKLTPNVDRFISNSINWENNISYSLSSIMSSYRNISATMTEVNRSIARGDFNFKEMTSDIMPTMHNTLLDVQELLISVDGIVEQYKRSPGDILFKQEDAKKGPGEE